MSAVPGMRRTVGIVDSQLLSLGFIERSVKPDSQTQTIVYALLRTPHRGPADLHFVRALEKQVIFITVLHPGSNFVAGERMGRKISHDRQSVDSFEVKIIGQ